jgi:hypothetical protein
MKIAERYPGVRLIHHVDVEGTLWGSTGRTVLRRRPSGNWTRVARFPFSSLRDLFGFSRPTSRVMRVDKCNLYVNRQGAVLGIRGGVVYTLRPQGALRPLFRIQGASVLPGGLCEDREGWTYLGEYFWNVDRGPVRIWRVSPDHGRWEVAFTFPAGSVRHVHGVYRDPFDQKALWVTTGDRQGECHLYRTVDRFRSLERFGDGGQTWRAVRLYFTSGHICWLTDSHLEQNHACRMSRGDSRLDVGQEVEGPVFYGATTVEGLHVAFTVVEPGPGVRDDRSLVLVSRDAYHWELAGSFRKDLWRPMKVFRYGVVTCPSGSMSIGGFFLSGEGLAGLDGVSALVQFRGALER